MIAPAWLVRAALEGSREAGAPLGVGDPYLSWLYQPAVRTFRVRLYGDDLSFLQAGHPALFASDSSFSAFYPDYHKPSDTADKLDAAALERMGRGVLGVVRALERVPRGPAEEPHWFAAFGRVVGWPWLDRPRRGEPAARAVAGLARRRPRPRRARRAVDAGGRLRLAAPGAGAVAPARPAPAPAVAPVLVDGPAGPRPGRQPAGDRRLGLVAGGRERRLARAVGDRGGARSRWPSPSSASAAEGAARRGPEAPRAQAPLVTPISHRAPAWWASRACLSFRGSFVSPGDEEPPARRR